MVGFERRRQADRRTEGRSGKRERRQNRCEACLFFKPTQADAGLCQKHQTLIKGTDFACTLFSPQSNSADGGTLE